MGLIQGREWAAGTCLPSALARKDGVEDEKLATCLLA